MGRKYKKVDACPQCCPGGGADLVAVRNWDGDEVWQCTNCRWESNPIRRQKSQADKPNRRQKYWIEQVEKKFGPVEIEMIGRNVFVKSERVNHRSCYGSIGPRKSLKLTVCCYFSSETVTDVFGWKAWTHGFEYEGE